MNSATIAPIPIPTPSQVALWTASCWALSVALTILVGGL